MVAPAAVQGNGEAQPRRKSSENLARRATQALSSLLEERAPAQSGVVAGGGGSGGGDASSGGGGGSGTGAGAGGKETLYTPWSKEGFHRRLKTFSASTWFDKPPLLSAIECARYGWVNVDVDEVECESCKGRLIAKFHHSFNPEAKERAAKALSEQATTHAHSKLCPWADNPVQKRPASSPIHRARRKPPRSLPPPDFHHLPDCKALNVSPGNPQVPYSIIQLGGANVREALGQCERRLATLQRCKDLPEVCITPLAPQARPDAPQHSQPPYTRQYRKQQKLTIRQTAGNLEDLTSPSLPTAHEARGRSSCSETSRNPRLLGRHRPSETSLQPNASP
jgi:hypothetical protein